MVVARPDYSQLPRDRDVVFLASGGRDSTAMILDAHAKGIHGLMLCGDTGLNRKEARDTLNTLHEYTGNPLEFARYQGSQTIADILKESFLKIPEALERLKTSKSSPKNTFSCCYHLKHRPMDLHLAALDKESIVLVMGLKGYDGALHRRYRMRQLRDLNQFHRLRQNKFLFYYPLRDCKDSDIAMILDEHDFNAVKSSGCNVCPIFLVYQNMRKKDPMTWLRSVTFARSLGVDVDAVHQTHLMQFCKGAA